MPSALLLTAVLVAHRQRGNWPAAAARAAAYVAAAAAILLALGLIVILTLLPGVFFLLSAALAGRSAYLLATEPRAACHRGR